MPQSREPGYYKLFFRAKEGQIRVTVSDTAPLIGSLGSISSNYLLTDEWRWYETTSFHCDGDCAVDFDLISGTPYLDKFGLVKVSDDNTVTFPGGSIPLVSGSPIQQD